MRIDIALARLLGVSSLITNNQTSLQSIFNISGRGRWGLHVEHLYAKNEKNQQLFLDPKTNEFDSIYFQEVRNKFGALLLLKDNHNLSSSNDIYKDKMDIYKGSSIIWNLLLIGAITEIDLRRIKDQFSFTSFLPDSNGLLPLSAIEIRQREMFAVIKHIWAF